MKVYNPFKAHIVKKCNTYYIRRFSFFSWEYLDAQEKFWWHRDDYIYEYCRFKTIELAKLRLIEHNFKIKRKSKKTEFITQ